MPRLDVLLSRNLGIGRREVKRVLRAKRVRSADGDVVLDDGAMALPPLQLPVAVRFDDAPVMLHHRMHVLLNKPLGVITAHADRRHEVAADLVLDAPLGRELRAAGRLDRDTSGLLLWTTEGTLLHRITHPRYAVPRTYHVGLSRPFDSPPADLTLDDGHRPDIVALQSAEAAAMHPSLRRSEGAMHHATITIRSGRFHEVRRIFAALGSEVLDLCRVAYGPVTLPPQLAPGQWLEIDLHDVFAGLAPAT